MAVSVLVVEDDRNIADLLKMYLEKEGYAVTWAADGGQGLAKFRAIKPDLVLLDVMMPVMDGWAVCRAIRAESKTPVIMLTAKGETDDKVTGLKNGADDYITKPVDEEEMLLRIKALLRRAKIAADRRIVVGDVVLDYDAFTVSRPGQTVELPQKEFLLLYKLLSYPGKIFTRIQLMDEIWGMDCETGWETVTVHVGRLRKRFEGWEEFSLESVRGLGYKAVKKV